MDINIVLEWVDLRWGVETKNEPNQETKELLVLKVCLDEIERCRPFMIVLMGDRYGWVPPSKRMLDAVNKKGIQIDVKGKSITALEIEYGVFENHDQAQRSFFYLREVENWEDMSDEDKARYSDKYSSFPESVGAYNKLEGLKINIKKDERFKQRVRKYKARWDKNEGKITGLEEFGNYVKQDLLKEIREELKYRKIKIDDSPEGKEQALLEEFVESGSKWFRGREGLLTELKYTAIKKDNPGIHCLIGETGSGKSAIFAKLYRELQKDNCLLLAHSSGISPLSTSVESILDKWNTLLKEYLEIDLPPMEKGKDALEIKEEIKSIFWEKQKWFTELIAQAATKTRVVCLVDALNQLERTQVVKHMSWLPDLWPQNAVMITTAIPGEESTALEKFSNSHINELPELSEIEALAVIQAQFEKNHKQQKGYEDVIEVLLKKEEFGKKAFSNPLWLILAMDYLLLLDQDDFSTIHQLEGKSDGEKLHSLLLKTAQTFSTNLQALYESLIYRAEHNFGKRIGAGFIRKMLNYIAASRYGLRRNDLFQLLNPGKEKDFDLKFANVVNYLHTHLVERGPLKLLDFSHSQLRYWVISKLDNQVLNELNSEIARHLLHRDTHDPLRMSEIMFHLLNGNQPELYCPIYLGANISSEELIFASKIIAEYLINCTEEDLGDRIEFLVAFLQAEHLGPNMRSNIIVAFKYLDDELNGKADTKLRRLFTEKRAKEAENLSLTPPIFDFSNPLEYKRETIVRYLNEFMTLIDNGDLCKQMRDHMSAFKSYQDAMEKLDELYSLTGFKQPDKFQAICFERLGDLEFERGNFENAIKYHKDALKLRNSE